MDGLDIFPSLGAAELNWGFLLTEVASTRAVLSLT